MSFGEGGTRENGAWSRVRDLLRNDRHRSELVWVVLNKATEFALTFAMLKLLTNVLGKAGYGEYNLAETAVFLGASLLLAPVHESYLRDYHGSASRGEERTAGVYLLRWYAIATLGVALLAGVSSVAIADWADVGRWVPLAAGLMFVSERWRYLGQDVLNIQRKRRKAALFNMTYAVVLVASIGVAVGFVSPTPASALLGYAAAAGLFALLVAGPMARDVLRTPAGRPSGISRMVVVYGLPYAALFVLHWVQTFGDRYLVKAFLDLQSVGLYVAAYQVCGIPYAFMGRITHELLTPIAYQRGQDPSDPAQLWSADKVLLGGLALQLVAGIGMLGFYALFGQRLLVLLTNGNFVLPPSTLVLLAAARFAQSVCQEIQPIFAVHHRMGTMLWFRGFGAAATLGICWWSVPRYGVSGAAAGTCAALCLYGLVLLFGPGGCWWLIAAARRGARAASR